MSSSEVGIHQADRLKTLNEIGRVVSSTLDLRTLYETIYQQIGRVMDTSHFFIALRSEEHDGLDVPYLREGGLLYTDEIIPAEGGSVTNLVIERGISCLFSTHEEYQEFAIANDVMPGKVGDEEVEAKIWVPLHTGRETIGALTVQSPNRYAYTDDDLQMLSVIASQAAVAIVNAALYEASQANVREMHALLHAAQTVNSSLDLSAVLDAILAEMREVLPYHVALIFLPNEREGALDIKGAAGALDRAAAEELRRSTRVPFGRGVTGAAYVRGTPVLVPDTRAFPDYIDVGFGSQSALAVPLKRGVQVIGVINVEREAVDAFRPDDMRLLSLFASQAAIAIENARLFSAQQHRVYELQTIESIVRKLTPLHEIPAIANVVESELKLLIDYHAARLFFLDAEHGILLPVKFWGANAADYRLRVGEGLAGWVALHGRSVIIDNTLLDSRVLHIPGTPRREESIMGAPLVFEGRVQGVITLSALGPGQFDENDLRLLEIVAGQTAIVFDRARLYDELRTEAITDPLTKLYNRRYLIARLKEEQARTVRSGGGLAAIMLDVDKFKLVNDRHGHDAGDAALQAVAGIIRGIVRTEDIVARYGGEEFCVLLPEVPREEAQRVAERLRASIERQIFPREAGTTRLTVSVGVAHSRPGDYATELFSRADAAMYEAKRFGGNAVFIAGDEGLGPLEAAQ